MWLLGAAMAGSIATTLLIFRVTSPTGSCNVATECHGRFVASAAAAQAGHPGDAWVRLQADADRAADKARPEHNAAPLAVLGEQDGEGAAAHRRLRPRMAPQHGRGAASEQEPCTGGQQRSSSSSSSGDMASLGSTEFTPADMLDKITNELRQHSSAALGDGDGGAAVDSGSSTRLRLPNASSSRALTRAQLDFHMERLALVLADPEAWLPSYGSLSSDEPYAHEENTEAYLESLSAVASPTVETLRAPAAAMQSCPRVVVSMTSTPARMQLLHRAVRVLRAQIRPPDAIYVGIASVHPRLRVLGTLPPEFLAEIERLNATLVHLPIDYGPLSKVAAAVLVESDPRACIVTMDDDQVPEPSTLARLATFAGTYPGAALGHEGWNNSCLLANVPYLCPEGPWASAYLWTRHSDHSMCDIREKRLYGPQHCVAVVGPRVRAVDVLTGVSMPIYRRWMFGAVIAGGGDARDSMDVVESYGGGHRLGSGFLDVATVLAVRQTRAAILKARAALDKRAAVLVPARPPPTTTVNNATQSATDSTLTAARGNAAEHAAAAALAVEQRRLREEMILQLQDADPLLQALLATVDRPAPAVAAVMRNDHGLRALVRSFANNAATRSTSISSTIVTSQPPSGLYLTDDVYISAWLSRWGIPRLVVPKGHDIAGLPALPDGVAALSPPQLQLLPAKLAELSELSRGDLDYQAPGALGSDPIIGAGGKNSDGEASTSTSINTTGTGTAGGSAARIVDYASSAPQPAAAPVPEAEEGKHEPDPGLSGDVFLRRKLPPDPDPDDASATVDMPGLHHDGGGGYNPEPNALHSHARFDEFNTFSARYFRGLGWW